ncbi:ABC transporter permease [Lysobacter korlensis]|uniref:ABC transporter permease n=1 Tax=Lysobacter korlensis TaxID=553636 RepID=A0ABV6RI88_9GAMM
MIRLEWSDLALAATLVLILAALSWRSRLGIERTLLVAAIRTALQLTLIGLVLDVLFSLSRLEWVAALAGVMVLLAGREVMARQARPFAGWWGYGLGTLAMAASSCAVTVLALTTMVSPTPWYEPRYSIPLLGMLLGNTMTGVALSLERLTESTYRRRGEIEGRLMLGATAKQAIADIRQESMRAGMTPIINGMVAAGIISLPGMMTGQILAGAPPVEAVKYQILIMFLIAAGTGFGTFVAVAMGSRRLFDDRERLRIDRLKPPRR